MANSTPLHSLSNLVSLKTNLLYNSLFNPTLMSSSKVIHAKSHSPLKTFLSLLSILFFLLPTYAQTCANLNSGDDSTLSVSVYNSNGLCQTHCSGYAFAIVQGKQCWCSNYSPPSSNKLGAAQCSDSCPVCIFDSFSLVLSHIQQFFTRFYFYSSSPPCPFSSHTFCFLLYWRFFALIPCLWNARLPLYGSFINNRYI